jgi:oligoribonuclease (3'-5' exoribonuclease)
VTKYFSIDLETTGLDPDNCQIIEFGTVCADTEHPETPVEELPRFHTYIRAEFYSGEPYALSMHGEIFRRIATKEPPYQYLWVYELAEAFDNFAIRQGLRRDAKVTAAGKNFAAFDLAFLRFHCPELASRISHRSFDPAMLYYKPFVDAKIPDLKTCLERAGIFKPVAHTALEDAEDVIRCLNAGWFSQKTR